MHNSSVRISSCFLYRVWYPSFKIIHLITIINNITKVLRLEVYKIEYYFKKTYYKEQRITISSANLKCIKLSLIYFPIIFCEIYTLRRKFYLSISTFQRNSNKFKTVCESLYFVSFILVYNKCIVEINVD